MQAVLETLVSWDISNWEVVRKEALTAKFICKTEDKQAIFFLKHFKKI